MHIPHFVKGFHLPPFKQFKGCAYKNLGPVKCLRRKKILCTRHMRYFTETLGFIKMINKTNCA